MTISVYSTAELMDVLDIRYKPTTFLTNAFFKSVKLFDKQEIAFDVIKGARKLAPFVSPMVQGRAIKRRGQETRSFTPAYIKPKMALVPGNAVTRRAGEPFGGTLSLVERRDLQLADDLLLQSEQIDNTIEWMAAQALCYGYVDVAGDDYPTVRVDFTRKPTHNLALAGVNLWSAATSTPVSNIRTWATTVAQDQGGTVMDIVLGANVFAALANHQEFNQLFKYYQPVGGPLPSLLPSVQDNEAKIFHGMLGQFRLWTYNAVYTDDTGVSQFYIPPNAVLLVASQEMSGTQCYGAIMDHDSLVPAARFAKMWKQEDPSVIMTMTQCAPLMVPVNSDSTFFATVL